MEGVTQFQYLGRTLEHGNIGKVWEVWRRLGRILQQEGSDIKVSALFYREVIQAVLLLGSKSWVLSDAMMKAVEGTLCRFPT